MSEEIESRVSALMRQLAHNVDTASRNPELVLNGNFERSSPSGLITATADSMGRVVSVNVQPISLQERDAEWLNNEINTAISRARKAADELDDQSTHDQPKSVFPEEDTDWSDGGSWLR